MGFRVHFLKPYQEQICTIDKIWECPTLGTFILICPLCNREFKSITNSHLKKEHQLTTLQFLELTGWTSINSKETVDRCRSRNAEVYNSPLLGVMGDPELAILLGVRRRLVTRAREKQGIPPPKLKYVSQEGVYLRSGLEAMYDCYLHELGIPHEHEVPVPGSRYISDFKIGNLYVEIEGMEKCKPYELKQVKKKKHYIESNLEVLWLQPKQVKELFSACEEMKVIDLKERLCSICNKPTMRMNKGMCPRCYGITKGRERQKSKEADRLAKEGPRPKSLSKVYRDLEVKNVSFNTFWKRYTKLGWTLEDSAEVLGGRCYRYQENSKYS